MLILFFLAFPLFSQSSLVGCISSENREIPHFDFIARESGLKKRILVISGIHGDEPEAMELNQMWKERLERIGRPSNHWRIIPKLNPDGVVRKTRYNANKVDLNRNFPTKDWGKLAHSSWEKFHKRHPRRYPGATAGSEAETLCLIKHIEDYRPDLVVSIHTPYGQFDFDGPANKKLKTSILPWKRIGTFPGSLGRYLWEERGIPVLTIELRTDSLRKNRRGFLRLQDSLSDLIE
ncbi:MAG: M14 family zinc carboxypeptidase [Bacteriovoracaceae bacterium]